MDNTVLLVGDIQPLTVYRGPSCRLFRCNAGKNHRQELPVASTRSSGPDAHRTNRIRSSQSLYQIAA